MMKCQEIEDLSAWCHGELNDSQIEKHVNECDECKHWSEGAREIDLALHRRLTANHGRGADSDLIMRLARQDQAEEQSWRLLESSWVLKIAALFIVCGVSYIYLSSDQEEVLVGIQAVDEPVKVIAIDSVQSGSSSLIQSTSIDNTDLTNVAVLPTGVNEEVELALSIPSEVSHVWAPNKFQTQAQAKAFVLQVLAEMGHVNNLEFKEGANGVLELESDLLDSDLLELVRRLDEADLPLMSSQQPQPESIDDIQLFEQLVKYKIQLTK